MDFTLMKEFMKRLTDWKIPGNSISVYFEGKEVLRWQTGFQNVEKQIPMCGNELFYIHSCSKVATVTAALQLYEKGFFLLDDPLYDFIPEFKNMYIKKKDGSITKAQKPITLRHLFTMTAGFDYNIYTQNVEEARKKTKEKMNTLEVIKCLAKEPLHFEPGTQWMYGLSHDILAAVVEVISGMKFRDYVKANLFDPLFMQDSYYHDTGILDRIAEQYLWEENQEQDLVKMQSQENGGRQYGRLVNAGKKNRFVLGEEYDSGGGGIITSVDDYSRFAAALANFGKGMNGEQILAQSTVELLRTNQLNRQLRENFNWKQLRGYGYGLGVRTLTDIAASGSLGSLGEFGWGGAAGATVLIDPDRRVSMFYTHHMLNPQEACYQPRLRNVLYACFDY